MVTIHYWSNEIISKNLENTANSFKAVIEDFFYQQSIELGIVSHTNLVKSFMKDPADTLYQSVDQFLRGKVNDKYYIEYMVLYDAQGNVAYSSFGQNIGSLAIPVTALHMKDYDVYYSDFMDHPVNEIPVIRAFTPIVDRQQRIGYMEIAYNNSYFSHIIENVSLENDVKVRLEDGTGKVISTLGLFVLVRGQEKNFDVVRERLDFAAHPIGMITYKNYKHEEVAYYTPIKYTNMRLFTAINKYDYQYPLQKILTNISLVALVVLFFAILVMTNIARKVGAYMEQFLGTIMQIKQGNYHARLKLSSNRELKYVADTFNDLLHTIEQNNNALFQSSERYRHVVKLFSDVFFEIDFTNDRIAFGSTKRSKDLQLDRLETYSATYEYALTHGVYEEDRELFIQTFERAHVLEHIRQMKDKSSDVIALEVRWYHITGMVIWVSLTLVPVFDQNGESPTMIGYVKNINNQKSKELDLMKRAQQDGLTKTNNKVTTQHLIETILLRNNEQASHALLVIDLDNFKQINDQFGHLVGDKVLQYVSNSLRAVLRSSDVIGRIGGDEFLVFLMDVDREVVRKKVDHLIRSLSHTFYYESYQIETSCSIGVSFYPLHGQSYTSLFEAADKALYHAKENGKRQYYIAEETRAD